MNRGIRSACWLFFAAIMYLILTEAVRAWVALPTLDNVGFTIVFLLFSLTHCAALEGGRRTFIYFCVSAIVSYFMEEAGVRTGLVFGRYHYSDMLGPKIGHVPIVVPMAWFMMIYPSWMVAKTILRGIGTGTVAGIVTLAVVSAWVMTAWDTVMDPGMAAAGNWVWETGGSYFGVPLHNYLGWLTTTFLVYCIVGWFWRRVEPVTPQGRIFAALPVILYAWFAMRYMTPGGVPALRVVAVFSMGTPALLAVINLFLSKGMPDVPPEFHTLSASPENFGSLRSDTVRSKPA